MPSHCLAGCDRIDDGHKLVEWMATAFGSCVYDDEPLGMAAFWVGMSSLGFWVMCQLPQFMENYQRQSSSALSHWFILEWFSGDVTNLVGAFLSNQLPTQKFTAGLFVVMDCCMLSQMYYYTQIKKAPVRDTPGKVVDLFNASYLSHESSKKPERATLDNSALLAGERTGSLNRVGVGCGTAMLGLVAIALVVSRGTSTPTASDMGAARMLLGDSCASDPAKAVKITGIALGWTSAAIYLNSRLPQVYKNYNAKTVEGLSWLMFFCAVMGNLTYALGVLLKAESWSDVNDALPWLVGSLGTIVFDVIIVIQCFMYGDANDKQKVDNYLNTNEIVRDSLLQSGAPSVEDSGVATTPVNRAFRSESFIMSMLNRDGSTPVYLDSGTQRMVGSMTEPACVSSSVP